MILSCGMLPRSLPLISAAAGGDWEPSLENRSQMTSRVIEPLSRWQSGLWLNLAAYWAGLRIPVAFQ